MWPGFDHGFEQGQLSGLYGALNSDDLFESAELRANVGAEFESEHWRYDISTSRIKIRAEAFSTFPELDTRVLHLLTETRNFMRRQLRFLTAERIKVSGVVPEERQERNVADLLPKKLLASRLRQKTGGERLIDLLPGNLSGAGLVLVGDVQDEDEERGADYHWHAHLGPVHSPSNEVDVSAELYFYPPVRPPEEAMISERLQLTYDFVKTHLVEFAEKSLG